MADEIIVLQIMFIAIGVVALSQLLNRLLGLKSSTMKDIRDKALNLQTRLANAQVLNDNQMARDLQMETMRLMKDMLKKQLVPMCLKCIIFIGILTVLNFIYIDYGSNSDFFFGIGWFWLYFLFALGFSLIIFLIKLIYKKATGKEDDRRKFAREIAGMLSPGAAGAGGLFQVPGRSIPQQSMPQHVMEPTTTQSDAWKDRIHGITEIKDSWKDRIKEKPSEPSKFSIDFSTQRICPGCGETIHIENNFCDYCSVNLKDIAPIGDSDEILKQMAITALMDPSASVRKETIDSLGGFKEEKVLGVLTRVLLNDSDDKVRKEAADEIGDLHHQISTNALKKALNDESENVRKEVIKGLKKIKEKNKSEDNKHN